MFLEITTKVDKTVSEQLGNKTILNNRILGRSIASVVPQGQEMLVDQADSKEWLLDVTSGPAFSVNLLALLNTTIDKIKFLHIECYKDVINPGDINAPYRFSLDWGGTNMGKMSQFQLANADSLTAANITVSNIEIPVGSTDFAILQVVFAILQ